MDLMQGRRYSKLTLDLVGSGVDSNQDGGAVGRKGTEKGSEKYSGVYTRALTEPHGFRRRLQAPLPGSTQESHMADEGESRRDDEQEQTRPKQLTGFGILNV